MKRKGKRRLWLRIVVAAPLLTVGLALLCAWLMLKGSIREEQIGAVVGGIAAMCAFVISLYTALCVPRKKLMWGLATAIGYGFSLLLGNLLFFGEAYGELLGVILPVFGGGMAASLLGTLRSRKIA